MNSEDEDKEKEPEKKEEEKKIHKFKDQILDESFRKAELSKKGEPEKKEVKRTIKKPFIKIGFLILIIAVISLTLIYYVPFFYINYETDYGTIKEFYSYTELKNNQFESELVNSLFESNCYNCSDSSDSYIGLTISDFTDTPKITIYILHIMILVGFIFTIFILVDRKKNFSENTITIIHSIFTAFIILTGIVVLLMNIKFLDAGLLQQMNIQFIRALGFNSVQLIFFVPYILIILSFILFIIGIILIRLNLNKAVSDYNFRRSNRDNLNYRFWRKI